MPTGLQKIYSKIPKNYELINHIITLGTDIIARKKAARIASADGGDAWLDICSGTGELAQYLKTGKPDNTALYAADFSFPMVRIAKSKPDLRDVPYTICMAEELPYEDHSFDLITISFATRNLSTSKEMLIKRFSEFHRVLKPGGRFVNLETSQPSNGLIRKVSHAFIKLTVKPIGSWVSGNKEGYAYLANSIPRFHTADSLCEILKAAGFDSTSYHRLLFGVMAIHKAVKKS